MKYKTISTKYEYKTHTSSARAQTNAKAFYRRAVFVPCRIENYVNNVKLMFLDNTTVTKINSALTLFQLVP